jgi:hypothetical protein
VLAPANCFGCPNGGSTTLKVPFDLSPQFAFGWRKAAKRAGELEKRLTKFPTSRKSPHQQKRHRVSVLGSQFDHLATLCRGALMC